MKGSAPEDMKIILIGNKSDLIDEKEISKEEGISWAEKQNMFFMEVSAKSNENQCVNKAMDELIREILKDMKGDRAE